MSIRPELERRIAEIPGVVRKPSRFGHGPSFSSGGREIAHFHGETRMDVRLTREEIQRRKSEGGLDPRLSTRGPSAEWVEVRVVDDRDIPLALELVEDAVRANS